jgi:integrase
LFNAAVDAELIERNPFRGLTRRTRGRSDQHPPTMEQMDRLIAGCTALGWYAPQMKALLIFAAYSGMRPGELFALEWPDIDFDAMRIHVNRRVYKGRVGLPKSNKVRTIALTAPARDAILGQPTRQDGQLVFRAKRGGRLSQPTLSGYWGQVLARAGLDFDFYLATKHWCVHYMHAELGLPPRVIAEQMGLDAPWGAAAADRLRPRRRGRARGDRQGVRGQRSRAPTSRLGTTRTQRGPDVAS